MSAGKYKVDEKTYMVKFHRQEEGRDAKQPWADIKISFCYEPPDLSGQFDDETWAVIPGENDRCNRINSYTFLSPGTWSSYQLWVYTCLHLLSS